MSLALPEIEGEESAEAATAAFRSELEELGLSQRGLATKMRALGDSRGFETVLRGVQRIATGDARVSGEMQVIMTLLLRERARAKRLASAAQWSESEGALSTTVEGVRLSVTPQSRGRWQVHAAMAIQKGYSPAIPHWRSSLEEAKLRAILAVDEAQDQAALCEAQASPP